ncbi:MAG: toluene-4-monooxygenase system B family protein [Porticoccaceae bacterium]
MALFPLHSNFQGDFVINVVAVDDGDTMDQVAEKCAYHSVGRRVQAQPGKVMRVRRHQDQSLFPRAMKVLESKLRPTETIDIVFLDE